MPLLTLNLSCEDVKHPARKHFEKTNAIFPQLDALHVLDASSHFDAGWSGCNNAF